MNSFLHNFQADLRRNLQDYVPCSRLRRLGLLLTLNSVHALFLIRLQQWLADRHLPVFPVTKILFWFFKIEVAKTAKIGPGLRLPHPMGIIIGPYTTLGSNCDLYADVRLVLANGCKLGPSLGNGVFLGDGAKVVGNFRIGNDSVVGVSSVVTKDVAANVTVVGIPAREIHAGRPILKGAL